MIIWVLIGTNQKTYTTENMIYREGHSKKSLNNSRPFDIDFPRLLVPMLRPVVRRLVSVCAPRGVNVHYHNTLCHGSRRTILKRFEPANSNIQHTQLIQTNCCTHFCRVSSPRIPSSWTIVADKTPPEHKTMNLSCSSNWLPQTRTSLVRQWLKVFVEQIAFPLDLFQVQSMPVGPNKVNYVSNLHSFTVAHVSDNLASFPSTIE